tara:strand:- start:2676 stop:2861 length:186 start_codon:yes stop_codon:yes gene_type:complete
MNCTYCNKPFTCGCQKHSLPNGAVIHKSCINKYNDSKAITPQPVDLSLELAAQQIKDLRNK